MTRYKGRPDAKSLARDFPHIVEMLLPPTGFGNRLNAMFDWHTANGIESQRGPERREVVDHDIRYFVRWCFADRATAEAFAAEFSGTLLADH
jgi:hypothetical protein